MSTSTKELKFRTNYNRYLIDCQKIKNKPKCDLTQLQRVLRPHAKTTLLNNTVLTYKFKGSDVRLKITKLPLMDYVQSPYYNVITNLRPDIEIQISALTLSELMRKINIIYKLIQP